MDAYAKTILTVIAACLALQVAQGFRPATTPDLEVSSSSEEASDRFQLLPAAMVRQVYRLDRATGRVWTMPLQSGDEHFWTPVEEDPPKAKARKRRKKASSESKKEAGGAEKDAGGTQEDAGGTQKDAGGTEKDAGDAAK